MHREDGKITLKRTEYLEIAKMGFNADTEPHLLRFILQKRGSGTEKLAASRKTGSNCLKILNFSEVFY